MQLVGVSVGVLLCFSLTLAFTSAAAVSRLIFISYHILHIMMVHVGKGDTNHISQFSQFHIDCEKHNQRFMLNIPLLGQISGCVFADCKSPGQSKAIVTRQDNVNVGLELISKWPRGR